MIQVVQHVPGFVDTGNPPERHAVVDTAALLALPFVARWGRDPLFHRFSVSRDGGADTPLLICEMTGEWWVVAYLRLGDGDVLELPDWCRPEAD